MVNSEIRKYGTPSNVSGMPGKTQFKENMKLPGSTARKWASVFEEDMYNRRHQQLILKRCYQSVVRRQAVAGDSGTATHDCEPEDKIGKHLYTVVNAYRKGDDQEKAKICMLYVGESDTDRGKFLTSHYPSKTQMMIPNSRKPIGTKGTGDLLDLERNKETLHANLTEMKKYDFTFLKINALLSPLIKANPDLQFKIYTEYKKGGVLYHGDPCCHSNVEDKGVGFSSWGGWNDWALFHVEQKGVVYNSWPGKIYGFVSLCPSEVNLYNKTATSKQDKITEVPTTETEYAIVRFTTRALVGFLDPEKNPEPKRRGEPVQTGGQEMQPNSSLIFWSATAPDMHLYPVTAINRSVVAYRDFFPSFEMGKGQDIPFMTLTSWNNPEGSDAYIFVRPRSLWGEVFIQKALINKKSPEANTTSKKKDRQKKKKPTQSRKKVISRRGQKAQNK